MQWEPNSKELVVKANALINASYVLTLVEKQIVLMGIVAIREQYKNDNGSFLLGKPIDITAYGYARRFHVEMQTAYGALKDASKSLFQRQFSYEATVPEHKNHVAHVTARWVSEIAYMDGLGIVRLTFSPTVIPLLVNLEKNFTSFEINQVSNFTSVYAIRLYEIVMQWRNVGKTPVFELPVLKNNLGILPDEYTRMDNFKTKVLEFALSQINEHTDLSVKYNQYKQGRAIKGFQFIIKTKRQPQQAMLTQDKGINSDDLFSIEGLTDKQLIRIVLNKMFISDYNHLVSATSLAGQDQNYWQLEMVNRLKKNPSQFTKRPIRDYLVY